MFRPVDTKQSFPKLEEETIRFWKENDIFRKSVEQRPADRQFTFYEGPPYANAAPGVHHILPRVFKDVIVRYKTMRGYRVPRRAGWYRHVASGFLLPAFSSLLVASGWKLEAGSWELEAGSWELEAGNCIPCSAAILRECPPCGNRRPSASRTRD